MKTGRQKNVVFCETISFDVGGCFCWFKYFLRAEIFDFSCNIFFAKTQHYITVCFTLWDWYLYNLFESNFCVFFVFVWDENVFFESWQKINVFSNKKFYNRVYIKQVMTCLIIFIFRVSKFFFHPKHLQS